MRMRRIALVIYEGETEVKALREFQNPSTGVYKLVEMLNTTVRTNTKKAQL